MEEIEYEITDYQKAYEVEHCAKDHAYEFIASMGLLRAFEKYCQFNPSNCPHKAEEYIKIL